MNHTDVVPTPPRGRIDYRVRTEYLLGTAADLVERINVEHEGAGRSHVISRLHLEQRFAIKSAEVTSNLAIAQELERIGLAR